MALMGLKAACRQLSPVYGAMGSKATGGRKQNSKNTVFSQKAALAWISFLLAALCDYKELCVHAINL